MAKNEFLRQLLTLQSDGTGAISAPGNWEEAPLLKVKTELDDVVEEVTADILRGPEESDTGRWHFFLGSPGNGKSAATGEIVRHLLQLGCRLEIDSETGDRPLSDLQRGEIPYLIKVYEPGKNFDTAWIAQDASVVRNPWSRNVDPAQDLKDLLNEAWEKGVSLIVCANRGVIESAARSKEAGNKGWYGALSSVVANSDRKPMSIDTSRRGKPRFKRVRVTAENLDARSLLLGSRVFERLIGRAVSHEGWEVCDQCDVKKLCPFRANREWLSDPKGRLGVLEALSNAELLSGQPIVLREAVAFLSLILAGCPRDYFGEATDPCTWVAERVNADDLFGLVSRRIYMMMFSAHLPRAIEPPGRARDLQFEGLSKLKNALQRHDSQDVEKARSGAHLAHLVGDETGNFGELSTDIGLGHLLGYRGVLQKLDPIKSRLDEDFFGRWHPLEFELEGPLYSALERRAKESWRTMYRLVEESTVDANQMLNGLSRWCTAFTIRIGGLSDRQFNMHQSLSVLNELNSGDEQEFRSRARSLERLLPAILSKADDQTLRISLNDHVELAGHWVGHNLRPRLRPDAQRGNFGLLVKFGYIEDYEQLIPAEVFHWLDQRVQNGLSIHCFPRHLLETVENYLIRIATATEYSLVPDDIELRVSMTNGRVILLERRNGEVLTEELQ